MRAFLLLLLCFWLVSCEQKSSTESTNFGDIIENAASDTSVWLTHGRTYDEQRFSPAKQISTTNVNELGLAWYADLDTRRGQEATPIVVDGKIYISTAWSKVKAYDAKTGASLWSFDPKISGESATKGCCDVVTRGLALWQDSLLLGAFDGRLISLDRHTGQVLWETQTTDTDKPYTITGAPRVVEGLVIIGNGGAEFGVRGFVAAYDVKTGEQRWKFYTVPDNPANGVQPDYLESALSTWTGEFWQLGGGGTVWDSMAYDPELELLYIGVGNGSPWNHAVRSPEGGDNLYLSSIVAVRPKTGEYVWHFQTTPGDTWDFTATQHILLADLDIQGTTRKVLMQAPKNGFFYVIDRETGEFISGENFVPMNWATGLDERGRPIEVPEMRFGETGEVAFVTPGAVGAHNWEPMSYHPDHNLVYIPARHVVMPYVTEQGYVPDQKNGWNTGVDFSQLVVPPAPAVRDGIRQDTFGELIAWDPSAQEKRWSITYPGVQNGGTLATAGDLVFQGSSLSEFNAFHAKTGEKLWSYPVQTGVMAAPVTYEIEGEQYVAVVAGWGGSLALISPLMQEDAGLVQNISRLLVFKLGAQTSLPPKPQLAQLPIAPPPLKADEDTVARGKYVYSRYCFACHGDSVIGGTVLPDLRRSGALDSASTWNLIVHQGALLPRGMPKFSDSLSEDDVQSVRHFVIARAHEDATLEDGTMPTDEN